MDSLGTFGVHVDAFADGNDDREFVAHSIKRRNLPNKERRPLAKMRPYEGVMAYNGRHIIQHGGGGDARSSIDCDEDMANMGLWKGASASWWKVE